MPVMNVLLGDMNYTLGIGPANTFLRVAGNLAGGNVVKLHGIFDRVLSHARGTFILSLQGCSSIDSAALAALARQHKALAERAIEIVLVDVPAQIMAALEGSHMDSLFEFAPSLQEAEKKYGRAVY
jgi:anti-anti-sigma factor